MTEHAELCVDDSNAVASSIPLSFPAILRNPGIARRYGQQGEQLATYRLSKSAPIVYTPRRDENNGRRWVRRNENAHFVGNPHITPAQKIDYFVQPANIKSTFPEPLPAYLPRTIKAPNAVLPSRDPMSANAGRFSLSLKGMRRELRRAGTRAEFLVRDVEMEIIEWLDSTGTIIAFDSLQDYTVRPIRETGVIYEVERSPLQLVWRVSEDPFARYVVHCCARYHEIVSFSKDVAGDRLTHLLRPNVKKADATVMLAVDTPPATDIDSSSHFDSDSEYISEQDVLSEVHESDAEPDTTAGDTTLTADDWSVVGDSDFDADASGNESELAGGMKTLAISPGLERQSPHRRRINRQIIRASSSPSRSGERFSLRPPVQLNSKVPVVKQTFYNYIFA